MRQLYIKKRFRGASQLPIITLTPLIDTVLVLLIVFMVTSTGDRVVPQEITVAPLAVELEKPQEKQLEKQEEFSNSLNNNILESSLFVRINTKGLLFINQQRVTRKDFKASLARALKKLTSSVKIILLKFEQGAPMALVQEVKRIAHQAEEIHGVYEAK